MRKSYHRQRDGLEALAEMKYRLLNGEEALLESRRSLWAIPFAKTISFQNAIRLGRRTCTLYFSEIGRMILRAFVITWYI